MHRLGACTLIGIGVLASTVNNVPASDGRLLTCSTSCSDNETAFASNRSNVLGLVNNPNSITVTGGRVYWFETGLNGMTSTVNILTCPTTGCGSGPTTFASGGSFLGGLYSDGTY